MKYNQIECPSCGKFFQLDKDNFSNILSQVKENEIEKQLTERFILNTHQGEVIFKHNIFSSN